MIAQAFDLLLKYVINLLKPKRPQVWRSIKTTNSHFCARVDCMVGARLILEKIGYSDKETDPTAMQFPDHVKEPDKEKLHVIAAELLMAKLEAEAMPGERLTRQISSNSEQESMASRQSSIPGTPNSPLQQRTGAPSNHLGVHQPRPDTRTSLLYTDTPPTTGPHPTPPNTGPHPTLPSTSVSGNITSNSDLWPSDEANSFRLAPITPSPTKPFTPHPQLVRAYKEQKLRYTLHLFLSHLSNNSSFHLRNAPDDSGVPMATSSPANSDDDYESAPESPDHTPTHEDHTHTHEEGHTPSYEDHTPTNEDHTHTHEEGHTPSYEDHTPTHGDHTPTYEERMPLEKSPSALSDDLKRFKKEREEINKKLNQKLITVAAVGAKTPLHPRTRRSTSIQGRAAEEAPTVSALQASSSSTATAAARPKASVKFKPPPIIEEDPLSLGKAHSSMEPPPSNYGSGGPPSGPISGTPCPRCSNLVMAGSASCSFCDQTLDSSHPHPTSSILPPPIHSERSLGMMGSSSEEPKPKPFRASDASTLEAIELHRRTRVFPAGMPSPPSAMTPRRASGGGQGGGVGEGARGGYRGPEGGAMGGVMGGAMGGEAAGGSKKSYMEMTDDKFKVWREEWRKRGFSDDEIPREPGSQPLPEYRDHCPPPEAPAARGAPPQRNPSLKKNVDYKQSKDSMHDLKRYQEEEERKKEMEKLGRDGESFMTCVKVSVE